MNDNGEANRPNRQRGEWLNLIIGLIYETISSPKNTNSEDKYRASQDRSSRRTAWATIAMAAFTLAIFVVGICQYRAMNGQLGVMQGQLDEMRDEQRPWIDATFQFQKPMTFSKEEGVVIPATLVLENVGNSPARDVWWKFTLTTRLMSALSKIVTPASAEKCEQSLGVADLGMYIMPKKDRSIDPYMFRRNAR